LVQRHASHGTPVPRCSPASAYLDGSWAARFAGETGRRPVGDIDLLVLGNPDRDEVYAAVSAVEPRLGRPVEVTIRGADSELGKHQSG
jgi:hypothetical protein